MRRREFVRLLGAILFAPMAAKAQQVGRTYHLGVLLPHPRDVPINVAFVEALCRGDAPADHQTLPGHQGSRRSRLNSQPSSSW